MKMPGKMFLSVVTGAILGGIALLITLFLAPGISLWVGLLVLSLSAIAMHLVLSIIEARVNRQYAKIEQMLQSQVLYLTTANFDLGGGVINGRVYVCRDGIVFASIDQTPYAVQQIPADMLARYEHEEINLRLYTKDGREYHLVLPDAPEVIEAIKTNYWNG